MPIGHEEVYEGDVDICFIPIGESAIEFFGDNKTTGCGKIAEIIARQGQPGVHHIALEVDDISAAVQELKAKGMPMLDQEPRRGAHGTRIAYMDPTATHGLLIELIEP
jgi:methylmalonyl-CoA/ethylmalonyl-CoA epimerase